jgi:putative transposase
MSIRKVAFVTEEFYHIYNRGNSKQKIFLDTKDYQRFVDLLCAVNREEKFNFADSIKGISTYEKDSENPLVAIGAYCLMSSHFHILLTPLTENGVSKFMQKLSTAYVMYFNQKYKRTGALFEGKFKSQHAGEDRYLKYLFSYIHLNPIKLIQKDWKEKGIKNKNEAIKFLSEYGYSSFLDYVEVTRLQNKILNQKPFPSYFFNKKDFLKEIFEWISFDQTL